MLLNNQWNKEEMKQEIKNYLETNWNENNLTKSMGCSKSSYKRKVYSYTDLLQEAGKIPDKQSKFTPKETRKRGTNKTQSK